MEVKQEYCSDGDEEPPSFLLKVIKTEASVDLGSVGPDGGAQMSHSSYSASINLAHKATLVKQEEQDDVDTCAPELIPWSAEASFFDPFIDLKCESEDLETTWDITLAEQSKQVSAIDVPAKRNKLAREKDFTCEMCEASFKNKCHLTRHMRTHTGEKPYICGICKSRFSQGSHLAGHIKTHMGVKPFACNICKARFSQKSHLTTHIVTHTGVKPYSCDVCGGRYSRNRYLTYHKRKQHGI